MVKIVNYIFEFYWLDFNLEIGIFSREIGFILELLRIEFGKVK